MKSQGYTYTLDFYFIFDCIILVNTSIYRSEMYFVFTLTDPSWLTVYRFIHAF